MTWLVPYEELTPDQRRTVELKPSEHRLIFGGPGSGKTMIILHRARYLLDSYYVGKGRYHIFVFTKTLVSYIRSALEFLNLDENCVSTFDSWCTNYYKTQIGGKFPWNSKDKCPDFVAIRKAVANSLKQSKHNKYLYDFILVDEGQDLDGDTFDILKLISPHITVCIDHKQKIYENAADEIEILKRLGLKKRNMTLLDSYRCSPYIVQLASQYISDVQDRQDYINQARTYQTERETPLLYYAANFDDEKKRLIEIIKSRQLNGDRIGILLPQKRQVHGFAKGLKEAGLEIEQMDSKDEGEMDFNNEVPKILTYHSAKGLTFDTILMPRLLSESFVNRSERNIEHLLFVGITRAVKWVYMSTNISKPLPALEKLFSLADQKIIRVQKEKEIEIENSLIVTNLSTETDQEDLLDLI